ncbi:glycoside hydrolase family 36 protein [Lacrimispora algidixylanolytica]|uniref:Alpha-galactosidase n=1 Tax=Lacrimispora algidixylanolytica TaxID=94868 RepID=A0A419SYZ2_9FIRM|nr:glycoside hydrolase family 36 protein [Lacrimispora algidixylanolytica]RKD30426.1 alpha-galactosidase [Lacrimispora algidixylanolytica]
MDSIMKEYILGDMVARYIVDEKQHLGLQLYPSSMPIPKEIQKRAKLDGMVQLKITGDIYPGGYACGNTLRNSESVERLTFKHQEVLLKEDGQTVITYLADQRGYEIRHYLNWVEGERTVELWNELINQSNTPISIEMFSSFSLSGISPYLEGDGHHEILIHRLMSRWSQEGKLSTQTIEELQLDASWTLEAVRCERFGQIGSLPVNHYFPFLTVEDRKNHVFWGVWLAHGASWQMEIYRKDEDIAISGGLADREFGHWLKEIKPGERFITPKAIVSVCHTDSIDVFTKRLTDAGQRAADAGPEEEQELPIVFNEYCTTWGCPSHENIREILDAVKGKGFTYFVIDCGWYKQAGVPWDMSMGDYEISEELFPEGMLKTVQAIKDAGLKPGIWFEIEGVGKASKAYEMEEHLLHIDGKVLTTSRRRFWDMKDPWVEEYLTEKVIGFLKEYGFEYMKIDYNDTIGIGCDGFESLGEGLRVNIEKTYNFLEKVKREIPGMVLENCASGGHRLEPRFMAATSMASFSDAHECEEIPIIAANLHRAVLPRQSQIWAVIRQEDSLKRIAYSIAATFLGRMCLSGDVTRLRMDQWNIIEKGMEFYKKISPVIKKGQSHRFGPEVSSIRHPEGWQAILRVGEDGDNAYITIHIFDGTLPEIIEVSLPKDCPCYIEDVFSDSKAEIVIEKGILKYRPMENKKAVALYLVRK